MLRHLLTGLFLVMTATAAVKIEKTAYAGWPNCYRVTNGEVELIVTTDVGPRVIRYGFVGGQNIFKEFTPQMGKSGEKEWMPRGGHRVWAAPEHKVMTYALDNGPIKAEIKGDTIELTQPVEPESGLQKQIIVKLAATGSADEHGHEAQRARPLGADDDGPGRYRDHGFPAARGAPPGSRPHESADYVGLHRFQRPALEIHEEVPGPETGPCGDNGAEDGPVQQKHVGSLSARLRPVHKALRGATW